MGLQDFDVGSVLTGAAHFFSSQTAVVFEGKRITYSELNNRANRLANGLLSKGVKKGDKVSILFYNSPQFIESYFATVKTGAVAVPLNFRLAGKEIAYQIDHSDSTVLIYSEEFSEVIDSIRPELAKVKTYLCDGGLPGVINYEELIAGYPSKEPAVDISSQDGCGIYYTGGTTGFPKGAYRSHQNIFLTSFTSLFCLSFRAGDVTLGLPPFFHLVGWDDVALSTFMIGGRLIVMKRYDPEKTVQIIEKEKVGVIFLVPTMIADIFSLPNLDKYDLSCLRVCCSGGAIIPTWVKRKIMEHLPQAGFVDGYGCTEGAWISSLSPHKAAEKDLCQGIPTPLVKVRVVDNEGRDVPQGEVGEVIESGPMCIREYYNAPQATAETIKEGWVHTGDMASLDEEGYIYIVDRKKDMIISGGENIYSAEVESVIYTHPKVSEVAVVGLPHKRWGEQVTAVVVLKPGQEMSKEELIDFCRESIAGYKCPKRVIFTKEPLPRSGADKVLKRALRESLSLRKK